MAHGEQTRAAVLAQPEWLRRVAADRRIGDGDVLYTGCGTSFHAAQTAGLAVQALELVVRGSRGGGLLVALSHEGKTPLTREAVASWRGPTLAVTAAGSPLAGECDDVVELPGPPETSMCHTRGYTTAVATLAALRGEDVSWLADAVAGALAAERLPVSEHERWLFAGAGRDWPTAQEAALKLREGVHLAAEAHQLEELLHGHLAAVDEGVRAFVLAGEGRAAARAAGAVAALRELGCEVTLVATRHPVVDIVPFQLLMLDLAEARGVDADVIRRDDERWARARAAYD